MTGDVRGQCYLRCYRATLDRVASLATAAAAILTRRPGITGKLRAQVTAVAAAHVQFNTTTFII